MWPVLRRFVRAKPSWSLACATTRCRKDCAQAEAKLKAWGKAISGVGKSLMGLGGGAVAGLAGLANNFADAAVGADNFAAKTGHGAGYESGARRRLRHDGRLRRRSLHHV